MTKRSKMKGLPSIESDSMDTDLLLVSLSATLGNWANIPTARKDKMVQMNDFFIVDVCK